MKVTFAAVGWEQLAISQLSAILKVHGHDVSLAFSISLFHDRDHVYVPWLAKIFDDRQRVIDKIRSENPDVICFSCITSTYQWALGVAEEAKQMNPDVITIFGGVHPSGTPERVIAQPQVDIVCIGEADLALPRMLEAIESRTLNGQPMSNMIYKQPDGTLIRGPQDAFVADLNSLPIPDKSIWEEYISQSDAYLTMGSRGCPYRCTFCFNSFFANLPDKKNGYIRQRSVEHIMHEMRIVKKRYKPKIIKFYDDVFILNKKWLKEFCDSYAREIRIPFQCELHANYFNEDVARWLAHAGCTQADLGVQSAEEEYKRKVLKRAEKNDRVGEVIDICRKYGINVRTHQIFGLPGEPMEAHEIARKLYVEHPPAMVDCYFVNYFPGTEIVTQAQQMGILSDEDVDKINDGKERAIFVNPNKNIDPSKVRLLQGYQIVFKLIPDMPMFIRKRLNPHFIASLPGFVKALILFFSDIILGCFKFPGSHIAYVKHNLYHIFRAFCEKCGLKIWGATRIRNTEPFSLTVPTKEIRELVDSSS